MLYPIDVNLIKTQLNHDENLWLADALVTLKNSQDPINDILNLSVVVKRKITSELSGFPPLTQCDSAEIIRIFLLNYLFQCHRSLNISATLKDYYQAADSSEKCALLKGLTLLDPQGEAVNVAVNAARCNSMVEFSALALNNPYASLHFAELNFNQLVLKTLFNGLDIYHLVDLEKRLNANLANMCFSYAVEQALAHRVPPASLWTAITFEQLNEQSQNEYHTYASHFYHTDKAHQLSLTTLITNKKLPKINAINH